MGCGIRGFGSRSFFSLLFAWVSLAGLGRNSLQSLDGESHQEGERMVIKPVFGLAGVLLWMPRGGRLWEIPVRLFRG